MTDEKWNEVHEKAAERDDRMCGICRENYGTEDDQILLPCSHMFHKHCLDTFEKFSGTSQCPICRKENEYKERLHIHDGLEKLRNESAIKIQSLWRGYRVRKDFRIQPKDQKRKRALIAAKMEYLSYKMEKSQDTREALVTSFLASIDECVSEARIAMHGIAKIDWEHVIAVGVGRIEGEKCEKKKSHLKSACPGDHCKSCEDKEKDEDSEEADEKEGICPICLQKLIGLSMASALRSVGHQSSSLSSSSVPSSTATTTTATNSSSSSSSFKGHTSNITANSASKVSNRSVKGTKAANDGAKIDHRSSHYHQPISSKTSAKAASAISMGDESQATYKSLTILSCTHIFHTACLCSFESYAKIGSIPICPVCRSPYEKKIL
eukprot:MONOS_2997.1-p1 / transcript=MONOS_2997.1 / gene=MONOS_2997 / organism=Monocercomonoides_exilis_PA203 / gene_product=RING finger protein 32 / transcript_product=RING finger protein 32 / location=Mono_scaffold00066:87305-88946(-) / protein_length=379 / sequence_SO=supercontig / SO=protein_coding / is_pseudo=false